MAAGSQAWSPFPPLSGVRLSCPEMRRPRPQHSAIPTKVTRAHPNRGQRSDAVACLSLRELPRLGTGQSIGRTTGNVGTRLDITFVPCESISDCVNGISRIEYTVSLTNSAFPILHTPTTC